MMPMLLDVPMDPTLKWAMLALAGGTIIYTVIIRPSMKRKNPSSKQPSPFSSSRLAQQRDTERVMQNLLVELSEMSRQITAQLDTRSQKLELLLQQADERIAALRQLQAQRPMAMDMSPPSPDADVFQRREPDTPPIVSPIDLRHQDVYTLADRGLAAGDIAHELGRPRGEVELILALRARA